MKFLVVLAAIFATSMAQLYHSHLYAAPSVAVPAALPISTAWTASVPSSRFTRTEWVQPGLLHTVPAVAQYHSITPAHVSYAHAPLVAAPVAHAHAPLVAPVAAPVVAAHAPFFQTLIKKK